MSAVLQCVRERGDPILPAISRPTSSTSALRDTIGATCMRFESMNQVFKTIAVGGNYRNTCGRCAIFWCRKTAQDRYEGRYEGWGETRILKSANCHLSLPANAARGGQRSGCREAHGGNVSFRSGMALTKRRFR